MRMHRSPEIQIRMHRKSANDAGSGSSMSPDSIANRTTKNHFKLSHAQTASCFWCTITTKTYNALVLRQKSKYLRRSTPDLRRRILHHRYQCSLNLHLRHRYQRPSARCRRRSPLAHSLYRSSSRCLTPIAVVGGGRAWCWLATPHLDLIYQRRRQR